MYKTPDPQTGGSAPNPRKGVGGRKREEGRGQGGKEREERVGGKWRMKGRERRKEGGEEISVAVPNTHSCRAYGLVNRCMDSNCHLRLS